MKTVFRIIFGFLVFISCKNDDDNSTIFFDAIVLGKGIDCGNSYLLKFSQNVEDLSTLDNTYYELNLPIEFKIEGKEISVEVRKLQENEFFACTTLGPGYNAIFIISATSRD